MIFKIWRKGSSLWSLSSSRLQHSKLRRLLSYRMGPCLVSSQQDETTSIKLDQVWCCQRSRQCPGKQVTDNPPRHTLLAPPSYLYYGKYEMFGQSQHCPQGAVGTYLPGSCNIHLQLCAGNLTNKELLSLPLGYIVFKDFIRLCLNAISSLYILKANRNSKESSVLFSLFKIGIGKHILFFCLWFEKLLLLSPRSPGTPGYFSSQVSFPACHEHLSEPFW